MADNEVTVKDETEGAGTANVDTKSLVGVGGKTVHRQIVSLGDPDTFGQEAGVNATGELLVKHTDAIPVTDNAGSLTVDGSLTTVSTVTNLVQQNGVAISLNTGVRDTGTQRVTIATNDVVPVTDNAGSLTVDQATAINLKAEVVGPTADNAANPTAKLAVLPVKANASDPTFTEGNVNPLSTDLAGFLRSKISNWLGSTAPTVGSKTSANSIPVVIASDQGNVAVSQATATSLNAQIVGDIADAAADSGKPVKISGVARTANRTAVTDGQRVNATFDDMGRLVTVDQQVRDLVNDQTTTITTTTETTIFTQVASVFNDLVMLTIANTSATATRIDFRDTTAGAVRFSLYCPAGATIGFVPKVPIKQTTVNTNWTAQLGTSVTDVRIFVQVVRNV